MDPESSLWGRKRRIEVQNHDWKSNLSVRGPVSEANGATPIQSLDAFGCMDNGWDTILPVFSPNIIFPWKLATYVVRNV